MHLIFSSDYLKIKEVEPLQSARLDRKPDKWITLVPTIIREDEKYLQSNHRFAYAEYERVLKLSHRVSHKFRNLM